MIVISCDGVRMIHYKNHAFIFVHYYNQSFEFSSLFPGFTSIRQFTKQVIGAHGHGVGSEYSNFLAEFLNIFRNSKNPVRKA